MSGPLPNLLVVGAMKAGTYSLHHYLDSHPAIEMSRRRKELNFFVQEMNWRRGLRWYASHWDGNTRLRGESSPRYTMRHRYRDVPARARRVLGPELRIIYSVRDPVRRLMSHWVHNVDDNKEQRSFDAVLSSPDRSRYVDTGRYGWQIEAWLEEYPPEQIRIVAFEDLVADPARVMRDLFAFLGVDSGHVDPGWGTAFNSSGDKRRETAWGRRLRPLLGRRRLRRNRWLRERLTRPIPKPEFDPVRHADIVQCYREDREMLQRLTGQRVPDWEGLRSG